MNAFLSTLPNVPEYAKEAFVSNLVPAIICLVIFLAALILTNKVATVLRYLSVIGLIGVGIYGAFIRHYPLIWIAIFMILIMAIVRIILHAVRTSRTKRMNRRIEERVLAKANSRRGSWQNRQGYSGDTRPIDLDYVPDEMTQSEISDLVENEIIPEVTASEEGPAEETPARAAEETSEEK